MVIAIELWLGSGLFLALVMMLCGAKPPAARDLGPFLICVAMGPCLAIAALMTWRSER